MQTNKINFNPSPDAVLDATDFMGNEENYDRVNREGWGGDEYAVVLFAAYKSYLNGNDSGGIWLTHFHGAYVASRAVQS